MPVPTSDMSWSGSLLWLVGVLFAAFLVSWLLSTRLRVGRWAYVGVTILVTGALTAGYVAWLGADAHELLTARWAWGLIAAPIAGAFPSYGMTHLPVVRRRHGPALAVAFLWDGVVFGVAEGVLMSALPAFVTWQLVHSLGWHGTPGAVARWSLPILASIATIVVHHLGYVECRSVDLVPITVGCTLLAVGYLVTASPITPMLGHVQMHLVTILHGGQLPPYPRAPAARVTTTPEPLPVGG